MDKINELLVWAILQKGCADGVPRVYGNDDFVNLVMDSLSSRADANKTITTSSNKI